MAHQEWEWLPKKVQNRGIILKQKSGFPVPMNNSHRKPVLACAFTMNAVVEEIGIAEPSVCRGHWVDSGVYYTEVRHPAFEGSIRVALHGINNPEQACQAVTVLRGGPRFEIPPGIF